MQYESVTSVGCVTLTLVSVFLLLEVIIVGLRLWSLHVVGRPYRFHDALILMALIVCIGHVTVIYIQTMAAGMGHHTTQVPNSVIVTLYKLIFVVEFTNTLGLALIRASVLFFYLDVFRHHKRFLKFVYGALAMTVAIFVAFTLGIFLTCRPVSKTWNFTEPGHCGNWIASLIASAAINLTANMVVLLLPLPIVSKLRLTTSDIWKFAFLFAIGTIIGFIDIARIAIWAILGVTDVAYNATSPSILSSIEIQLGVIAACLPCVDPVLRLYHKYRLHRSNSSTANLVPSMPSWTRKLTLCDYIPRRTGSETSSTLTALPSKSHRDRSSPSFQGHDSYFLGRAQGHAATLVESVVNHGKTAPPSASPEMSSYDRNAIVVTRDVTVEVKPGTAHNSPV